MPTTAAKKMIELTLPDGSKKQYAHGVTGAEVASSIGRRLAKDALAIRVNGSVCDLAAPLTDDAEIAILTFSDPEGRQVFWHSTAHVMAQAVTEVLPGTKLAIGPPIEEGFYYDFDPPRPFRPEDLEDIEKRMREIVEEDAPFERHVCTPGEAQRRFADRGETYKLDVLKDITAEGQDVSLYTSSHFEDLCRGPHVPSTGRLKSFKLLSIAGAYWRDTEGNPQLQRIYGISYPDPKDLTAFLERRAEAERRDHRKLGRQLDLYSIREESGAGLVLWHPKGSFIRRKIEEYWYRRHQESGYELVYTPHIGRLSLWETSGHTDFYAENMFPPFEVENNPHQLKPMNCPFHILIYQSALRSYRDLPLRWAELGTVYRYERSGVLHGLFRVRGLTQDDAHLFCRRDQVVEEIGRTVDFCLTIYEAFGFTDVDIFLSTRPEKAIGEPADWEMAEGALRRALDIRGKVYGVDKGGGAFYGPKIDFHVRDAVGRLWQCGTIQFDFNLPERFDLSYIGEDGQKHRPVMVHRALLGALERFFGVLIEHYGGAFPVWLAPIQARVLAITDKSIDYANKVAAALTAAGLRATADVRSEKIGLKIREAETEKIPYMLVVGEREQESGTVALRARGRQDLGSPALTDVIERIRQEDRPAAPAEKTAKESGSA